MPETFSKKRERFNEALDRADAAFVKARDLLDELPSVVAGEKHARQLVDAHQAARDTLRSHLRALDKL